MTTTVTFGFKVKTDDFAGNALEGCVEESTLEAARTERDKRNANPHSEAVWYIVEVIERRVS